MNEEKFDTTVNITVSFTPDEWQKISSVVEMHKRKKLTQDEIVGIVSASCREKTLSYALSMKEYERLLLEGLQKGTKMDEKIADADGNVDQPGHTAAYPPGTKVFFQNGEYSGHETPEEEPPKEEKPAKVQKKQTETIETKE